MPFLVTFVLIINLSKTQSLRGIPVKNGLILDGFSIMIIVSNRLTNGKSVLDLMRTELLIAVAIELIEI